VSHREGFNDACAILADMNGIKPGDGKKKVLVIYLTMPILKK
jgi:hypothetical protein